jgi:FixJ family two-component response regulator
MEGSIMPIVHVVDDNFTVRESIGFVLEDAAYLVRDYASAEDFLRSVEADKPGCVIADLHMAAMSGLDLLDRLKHMGVALPTIMITGDDSVENIVLAMRRGAIDFIFKPFTSATLLATVRSALGRRTSCG